MKSLDLRDGLRVFWVDCVSRVLRNRVVSRRLVPMLASESFTPSWRRFSDQKR